MPEHTTRTDYAARLERVVAWLGQHLDDDLDLARMADVAGLSPYHFHRIYHAMQKETAADTIRRLRLHRAAVELIAGALPVARIARRAGYGSHEAFTRAFKAAYGVPPARYRAAVAPETSRSERADPDADYPVTIRDVPAFPVAALAHRGDYQKIDATFIRLAALMGADARFGAGTYGIYYDDPSVTPVSALRSEACLAVAADWVPRDGLARKDIRGGRYAVVLHVGPYAELGHPYEWLYGAWLPRCGEAAADAPCIEAYLNDARTCPPAELQTEVWLPLV